MPSISDAIIADLRRTQAQREIAAKMGMLEKVKTLQEWQCQRLLNTHVELANQSRYQTAMAFFVEELYGPKDFSQRDADLVKVVPKLAAVLPTKAMRALQEAVAVNALSFELDLDITERIQGELTHYSYAVAYRQSERLADRTKQLTIIYQLGEQLADVVRIPGVSILIKLARKPAKLAGLLTLHGFLERGYHAFRKIGDVHDFINPVIDKEKEIMQILLASDTCLESQNPIPPV